MKIIPLKEKFNLTEEDIGKLSSWMVEGFSLEEIYFHMSDKLTVEQIFVVASVISREMYGMSLNEMCPELIAERAALNTTLYEQWQQKKTDHKVMAALQDVSEDLALFELELQSEIAKIN